MKGVPLRMEVGPRDIRNDQVVMAKVKRKNVFVKKDILSEVQSY